jgi:hypothetical protein
MFRELVESNGTVLNYEDLKTFYRGSISDIPYKFYRLKGKDEVVNNKVYNSVEEMYLDYCIENGVKLEWLKFDYDKDCHIEYNLLDLLVVTNTTNAKLIAAIYAHDIKIIAT